MAAKSSDTCVQSFEASVYTDFRKLISVTLIEGALFHFLWAVVMHVNTEILYDVQHENNNIAKDMRSHCTFSHQHQLGYFSEKSRVPQACLIPFLTDSVMTDYSEKPKNYTDRITCACYLKYCS